jgi:Arc/MetJ-type ribon-helix-helix transcriptional regulator
MIHVSSDSEGFLDQLVASGRFASRDAVIEEAIQRLRDDLKTNGEDQSALLSADEWCDRFEAWSARHRRLPHEADDSREGIYAGRGE